MSEINANAAIKELLYLAKTKNTRPEAQKHLTGLLPVDINSLSPATTKTLAGLAQT